VRDRREVARHVAVLREAARRAIVETLADRRRQLVRLTEKYGFRASATRSDRCGNGSTS
jgi:hypothetical protein